jgi:hypothetical protein
MTGLGQQIGLVVGFEIDIQMFDHDRYSDARLSGQKPFSSKAAL